jgi:chromosome partitioning protein
MILAIGGLKGGIGKSTVAINLAAEVFGRGKSVLLVDADPSSKTTRTWHAVASELGYETPTVLVVDTPTMHKPGQLSKAATAYDLVVIDCPPQADAIHTSALAVSDLVLVPCAPSVGDVWALDGTAKLIEKVRMVRPQLSAWIVINKQKKQTAIGKGVRSAIQQSGLFALKTELSDRVAYREFLKSGRGVMDYASRDEAALEIRRLADELETLSLS